MYVYLTYAYMYISVYISHAYVCMYLYMHTNVLKTNETSIA